MSFISIYFPRDWKIHDQSSILFCPYLLGKGFFMLFVCLFVRLFICYLFFLGGEWILLKILKGRLTPSLNHPLTYPHRPLRGIRPQENRKTE